MEYTSHGYYICTDIRCIILCFKTKQKPTPTNNQKLGQLIKNGKLGQLCASIHIALICISSQDPYAIHFDYIQYICCPIVVNKYFDYNIAVWLFFLPSIRIVRG